MSHQSKRANRWRSDLLVIRENIRWMEKIAALQLGFGGSLEFTAVMQLVLETGAEKDILRPFLLLCMLLSGLCVMLCGFVVRGVRMWSTSGYVYACLLANCLCLAVLLPPLGFAHNLGSLAMQVSQSALSLGGLDSKDNMKHNATRTHSYMSYVNSYIFLYFISNLQLAFCILLCSLQANLCCITVNFREQEICYASMFVKFGVGIFQWIGKIRSD